MAFIEFSTRHYLPHERLDATRETCAAMANMAPDIADDGALDLSVRIRLLPGVAVAAFESSPLSVPAPPGSWPTATTTCCCS